MVWAFVVGLGAVGLAAVVAGLRGRRVNDHPICRGCGFDLVGLVGGEGGQEGAAGSTDLRAGQWHGGTDLGAGQGSGRCPECGRELGRRRAMRQGARRRRRGLIAVGALLLLVAAGWGGALGWGRVTAFDWNTVKPTALLMLETRQPAGDNAGAGMQELTRRLEAGKLSREQIDAVVARVLEAQGDDDAIWHSSWGDLVQAAHGAGALTASDLERYARQAVRPVLTAMETRMAGRNLFYGLQFTRPPRAGSQPAFYLQPTLRELRIDGAERPVGSGRVFMGLATSGAGSVGTTVPMTLAPGEHEWELVYEMIIIDHPSYDEVEPLVSWRETFTGSLTVGGE